MLFSTMQQSESAMCPHAQSCLILCNLMDYSPAGSSIHGISQARLLEWAAISCSRISYAYTYIPYRAFSGAPGAIQFSLVVYFTHYINSVYLSISISQFLPPHPLLVSIHLFCTSLSLLLLCNKIIYTGIF